MIHRLPDGLSFTCLTMTQENRRFKQCCHAFGFSFLNDSFCHYSVLMEEAMDGILKKKRKKNFFLALQSGCMSSLVAVLIFYQFTSPFALRTHHHLPWPLYQPSEVYVTNQTLKVMEILEVTQGHTVSGWWKLELELRSFSLPRPYSSHMTQLFSPQTPATSCYTSAERHGYSGAPEHGSCTCGFVPAFSFMSNTCTCMHTHRAFFVYAPEADLSSLGSDMTSCEQCCTALVLAPALVHAEPPWHSASFSGGYSTFHTMLCILPVPSMWEPCGQEPCLRA